MAGFAFKVKSKSGQQIVKDITPSTTIAQLKSQLSKLTTIPIAHLHILSGYPPKPLVVNNDDITIQESGLCSGDMLIVEEKAITPTSSEMNTRPVDHEQSSRSGILMKKVVPADNSCLFTSIGYVLNGKIDTEIGSYMRQIIAQYVSADKETYSEAMLGKSNAEYCDWIQKPESWGGAIEVSILSTFYGIEIAVVDTQNAIINRFGEDKHYGARVFLLFDGIHYDPLFLEPLEGGDGRTIFRSDDNNLLSEAEQLAREARASRQFTDVNRFTLRCIQCDTMLTGQVQAQTHAKETGHTDFGEV